MPQVPVSWRGLGAKLELLGSSFDPFPSLPWAPLLHHLCVCNWAAGLLTRGGSSSSHCLCVSVKWTLYSSALPALKVPTRVTCRVVKQLLLLTLVTNKAIPGPSISFTRQVFWDLFGWKMGSECRRGPLLTQPPDLICPEALCPLNQGVTEPMWRSSDIPMLSLNPCGCFFLLYSFIKY